MLWGTGEERLGLHETYNGLFIEGKEAGKEMNLSDLRRSYHRKTEG